VIDNSGALLIECVNVLKHKVNHGWAGVGDEIVCVVKRARPISALSSATSSSTAVKVRRGDVRRAVIVRTKKSVMRPDGRIVRFDDNAAVLLNNKKEMLGTRIAGPVSAELRLKGWGKIVSIAPKVRTLIFYIIIIGWIEYHPGFIMYWQAVNFKDTKDTYIIKFRRNAWYLH
jgi:ribosomal protein L14